MATCFDTSKFLHVSSLFWRIRSKLRSSRSLRGPNILAKKSPRQDTNRQCEHSNVVWLFTSDKGPSPFLRFFFKNLSSHPAGTAPSHAGVTPGFGSPKLIYNLYVYCDYL